MGMSNVMKERRSALGMSQAQLAELAGVNARQIVRYEAGEQQPVIAVAAAIARALEMSLSELAAEFDPVVELSGTWWSAWEAPHDPYAPLTVQHTRIAQRNTTLIVEVDATETVNQGSAGWRADLRLWDNDVLVGTYRRTAEGPRSWGTILFALGTEGEHGLGRWVGQAPTGEVVTGRGWLARERARVEELASTPSN